MDSGFGDDEAYSVYDKPWRQAASLGNALYRPTAAATTDYGNMDELMSTKRFVPDRGFAGADSAARRSGPVEFQQVNEGDKEEEDLFGVIGLLSEAKKASKRGSDADDRADRDKRRRRD